MSETFITPSIAGKEARYKEILPQLSALVEGETDLIASLANIAAGLKQGMNFFWVGFYIVKGNQLVLGPFQGPVACARIDFGKGVCGESWKEKKTIIVPDVTKFPGHIACSSDSKSEIVVPIIRDDRVVMVLDVDSDRFNDFDDVDAVSLAAVADLIDANVK